MNVYIEYVVLNNFFVNLLLLYWASIIAKRPIKWFFLLFSAIFGTTFAVFLPFARYDAIIIFKFLLPFAMCAALHNYKNFKQYCSITVFFCVLTFIMGGAVLALVNITNNDLARQFDFSQGMLSAAISALLTVFTFIVKWAIFKVAQLKRKHAFVCEVKICVGGVFYDAQGYLDSGNKLYYKNAVPVIVVDKSLFGNNLPECKHKIKVKTVTEEKYLDAFFPDMVELIEEGQARQFDNVMACFGEFLSYKVILHGDMAC